MDFEILFYINMLHSNCLFSNKYVSGRIFVHNTFLTLQINLIEWNYIQKSNQSNVTIVSTRCSFMDKQLYMCWFHY